MPTNVSLTEHNLKERMENALNDLATMLQTLSSEQQTVNEHIVHDVNQSIFVVYGSAGTGKSYLLALLSNAFFWQ